MMGLLAKRKDVKLSIIIHITCTTNRIIYLAFIGVFSCKGILLLKSTKE